MTHIPDNLYKKILKSVPISTVDVVIVRNGKEFLLTKRINKPFKGKWFIPGGRVLWGEELLSAVARQVEALGIKMAESIEFLCVSEFINPPNNLGVRQHSLLHVFIVKVEEYTEPEVDEESSEVKWFYKIDPKWPQATIDILTKAGFKK